MKKIIPQAIKNIYHLGQAILANVWFGWPTRKLIIIGITGTDGKTTTCQMAARILEEAGKKVAMASTINFRINGKEEKNLSHFTTLSSFAVQRFARQAASAECEYLILETSSHALDQQRVWGINYKIAVITNVTREHLDYHKTMEKYRQAKAKLFRKAKIAIVNADMNNPEEFLQYKNDKKFTYSLKDKQADILAEHIELGIDKSIFIIKNQKFTLHLIGDFNIENALAAVSIGVAEGIDLRTCAEALEKISGVPGRMEYVPNNKGLNILVDFALTPDALEKLYNLLVKIKKPTARVIAVFGSCGERDRGKRPIVGGVVSRFADFVIVTNDDLFHEDPAQIITDIVAGIKNKKENENFWIIPDRRVAIAKALQLAQLDDIIAVTGMGAEETMVIGDQKIPWNDRAVILEELKKY
jgi:UDP-N-acetylmuramoyl-L-alanyl-D-glutamate--2,6-diaminopimelate ligase